MINNNSKISVIIPVWNGATTLRECLLSVANQTYHNYEIIVVDNNSTDQTKQIITELAGKFSNIIYVFASRQGRGAARNAGLAVASGDIIAMTDVDCVVSDDWLSKLTDLIATGKELAVSGFECDATLNYWSKMRQLDDRRLMQKNIQGNYTTHLDTKNFAIRANILKRLKFNSELLACEDLDLEIRLRLEQIKIYFLPDLLVAHYHDASVRALINTQLTQGYSAAFIIASYQKNPKFIEIFNHDNSLNFTSLRNFILFLPWAVWQFIFHPVIAPYRVLADLAWKIGVIKFKLN